MRAKILFLGNKTILSKKSEGNIFIAAVAILFSLALVAGAFCSLITARASLVMREYEAFYAGTAQNVCIDEANTITFDFSAE